MKDRKMRGVVTPQIEEKINEFKSKHNLDFDNKTFLRFAVYLEYLSKNSAKVDTAKITEDEHEILFDLREQEFVAGGASSAIAMTREFYDFVNDILFDAYVLEVES